MMRLFSKVKEGTKFAPDQQNSGKHSPRLAIKQTIIDTGATDEQASS